MEPVFGSVRPFHALRQSVLVTVLRRAFFIAKQEADKMKLKYNCPGCGKPMKYLAQIQWDTVMDGTEGTLYIEFCPDCQIVSMQHQQT